MPENELFQQPDLIVLHDGQQHGPLLAGETAGTGQKRGPPVQMRQDVFTECCVEMINTIFRWLKMVET